MSEYTLANLGSFHDDVLLGAFECVSFLETLESDSVSEKAVTFVCLV